MKKSTIAALPLAVAAALLAVAAPCAASTFIAWQVSDVAHDDVLMVRAFPNPHSTILVGYPNAVPLSMTGRCTGAVRLDLIQTLPDWEQRRTVEREWCEVWLDPYGTGEFRSGWVYGRYIAPFSTP